MDNYVVSARKYRPTSFDDVIGQDHVTTTLKNAIQNKKVAQSLLFCGPRGVGKTTCARIVAKMVNSLKKLEYRGYDSAGIATLNDGFIKEVKCEGRVEVLEKNITSSNLQGEIAIGHVRWAQSFGSGFYSKY